MVWRWVFLAFSVVLSSGLRADDNASEIADAFRQQQQCWRAWDGLVDGWLQQGGFAESMQATRFRIARDRKSVFAAVVRSAWAQQRRPDSEAIGGWPIAEANMLIESAIEVAARPFISSESCRRSAWLQAILWDALRAGGTQAKRLDDMPPELDLSDAHQVSIWTLHWLLVRHE